MKTIDYLTLKVPVKIVADNILFIYLFFFNCLFQEKKAEYFMGTVCIADYSYENVLPYFLGKMKNKNNLECCQLLWLAW